MNRIPRQLAWTAGVVFLASLPHTVTQPIWMGLILFTCIGWRIACELTPLRLPGRSIRLGFAFCCFVAAIAHHRGINGVEPGSGLLLVMIAMKFLETRTARDHMILVMLAYFLVFAALLTDRGPLVLAYLAVTVLAATGALLQASREGPALPYRVGLRHSRRLILHALPVMLILFLLFPRLPGPLWGIPANSSQAVTGLGNTMSPGDITDLGLSDDIAFRVAFDDRAPTLDLLYWRGPVLSEFDGRTWSALPSGFGNRVRDQVELLGEPVSYRMVMEPHHKRWVLALDMPGEWASDKVRMNRFYQLVTRDIEKRRSFEITSYPQYRAKQPLSDDLQRYYLRLPEGSNPRTQELAERLRTESPDAETLIANALGFFQLETFFYTLTPPPLGRHTADEFLFDTREGFCEHYASAFAILMRYAGLPARVVTGYQGGELNGFGDYFIIRQSDAHAWVEVWLEDAGWVRIDPTAAVAPLRISDGLSNAMGRQEPVPGRGLDWVPGLRQLVLAWDAVGSFWNDWVLDYGPELQFDLLSKLGFEEADYRDLVAAAVVLLGLFGLALTGYLALTMRRQLSGDPWRRSYARLERRLAKYDIHRQPWEGPIDFSRRAARLHPEIRPALDQATQLYVAGRYGADSRGRGKFNELLKAI